MANDDPQEIVTWTRTGFKSDYLWMEDIKDLTEHMSQQGWKLLRQGDPQDLDERRFTVELVYGKPVRAKNAQ